jgi:hypothetical protein
MLFTVGVGGEDQDVKREEMLAKLKERDPER